MDGGGPPPLEISQKAHAGCLSFEMSSGTCPLIVNCGAAPPAFHTMANNARATVCHSTLTVNNRSSAQFLHEEKLRSEEHTSLLEGPALVEARYERSGDQHKIVASHDGYLAQFGIIHNRLLSLSNDGYTLIGEDWIELPMGHDVIQKGLGWPFAVHFHIHPDVVPARSADGKSVILTLPDSQVWTFSANDMVIHLEESIFYADFAGPCQSVQIVIRGNCLGPVSIPWKLSKSIQSSTPDPKNVPDWISGNVISLESALEEQSEQPEKDDKSPDKEKIQKAGGMTKPKITDLVEDTDDEVAADDDKPVKKTSPDDQVSTDQRVEAKTDKPSPSQIRKRKKRARHNAPSHFAKLKPVADKSDTDNQPPPLPKTGGALKGDQPPPPPSGKTGRNTAIIKGEKGGQQKDAEKGGRATTDKTATNNKGKEAPLSPQPPPMPKPKRDDE